MLFRSFPVTIVTAWGAVNAISGYYSNIDNIEGTKRFDSICYGEDETADAGVKRTMNKATTVKEKLKPKVRVK